MKRSLAMTLLILLAACRSATSHYSGSDLLAPLTSGSTDSFFPDGPTAGWQLWDTLHQGGVSPATDTDFSPRMGIRATFMRSAPPLRSFRNNTGARISLIDGENEGPASDLVLLGGDSNGGSFVQAWFSGNPEATMYRISSPGYPRMLERPFPSASSEASTIQLKHLGAGRFAWRCRDWVLTCRTFVSLDEGQTWKDLYLRPETAFKVEDIPGASGHPVLLDIRAAQPGHYFHACYRLP